MAENGKGHEYMAVDSNFPDEEPGAVGQAGGKATKGWIYGADGDISGNDKISKQRDGQKTQDSDHEEEKEGDSDEEDEAKQGEWKEVRAKPERKAKGVKWASVQKERPDIPATFPMRTRRPAQPTKDKEIKLTEATGMDVDGETKSEEETAKRIGDHLRYVDQSGRVKRTRQVNINTFIRTDGPMTMMEEMEAGYDYVVIQGLPASIANDEEEVMHRVNFALEYLGTEETRAFTSILKEKGCFAILVKIKHVIAASPVFYINGLTTNAKGEKYTTRQVMACTLVHKKEGEWLETNHMNVVGIARGIGGSQEEINLAPRAAGPSRGSGCEYRACPGN